MASPLELRDRRPLAERTRPTSLSDMIGNPGAIADLRAWGKAWAESTTPPSMRAALLEGRAGVGKTSAALALAHDMGWTVIEMNASDARNQSAIEQVAGRAAITHTLGSTGVYEGRGGRGRSLILLDEADSLTGRAGDEAKAKPSPVSFREFLRGRYQTVEALANGWGLGRAGAPPAFERWDQAPATAGRGAWTKLAAAQRDVADWRGTTKVRDTSDRGGLGTIARLVRETRQPLILTVNDERPLTRYSAVFRSAVKRIRFYPVREPELRNLLRRVSAAEGFEVSPAAVDAILRRSHGDVRGAMNDLEAIAPLAAGVDQVTVLGGRDQELDFFDLVGDVLGEPRFYRSVEIRERIDATPDDLLPWMEENLPRFARDPVRRAAAYETLARAEFFLSRARRYRVWGLWSFASELMTGGVSLSLGPENRRGAAQVAFPQFLGEMGRSKSRRALRTVLLAKVGHRYHISRRKGVEEMLPFLEVLLTRIPKKKGDPVPTEPRRIARQLALQPEELAFLLGTDSDSSRVAALLDEETHTPQRDVAGGVPETSEADSDGKAVPATKPKKVQRRLAEF
ncbi:MAG: AAA family ATPase [Thermoplasmata archaeon]|nr:AAA family ATPase [Thermoplasmata archaeon]